MHTILNGKDLILKSKRTIQDLDYERQRLMLK